MKEIEITYEELEKFRGCFVSIAVPENTGQQELFWYYGTIVEMNPENIKLRFRKKRGFKIIPVRDIRVIETRGEGFRY